MKRPAYEAVFQSCDTGTSAAPQSDVSVCTTWGFRETTWYLLDVWRGQSDNPDLKSKVLGYVANWRPDRVPIEDAAAGRPLLSELFGDATHYQRITPKDNKKIRFAAACALVGEGRVSRPADAPGSRFSSETSNPSHKAAALTKSTASANS